MADGPRVPEIAPALEPSPSRRAGVTLRSFLIGTVAAGVTCALVPYNDYVVANTLLIGSYLPLALVLALFVLVVLVNGPLHRFCPGQALGASELAVILTILLAASGVASNGLMRTLLPTMVSPIHHGGTNRDYWLAFTRLGLPQWLFPRGALAEGPGSSIVTGFYLRLPEGEPVPYAAWLVPLAGWGVFFGALFATLLSLSSVIGPQWAVNERLSFPLAKVQLELIEPPARGQALNRLFRSRAFWIATCFVIFLHSLTGLNRYFPTVPVVPLRYDFNAILANEPWSLFSGCLKAATVYFTLVGLSYFIPSRVSFSMWSVFLLVELFIVRQRFMRDDIPYGAWMDQHLGATVAFLGGVLFVGRHRWLQMLRCLWPTRRPASEGPETIAPVSRAAAILGLAGPVAMTAWLAAVGVHLWIAVLMVAVLLSAHLIVARIVAETGLPFIRSYASPLQVATDLPIGLLNGRDVFFAGVFAMSGTTTTRESLLPFAMHGQYINDQVAPGRARRRAVAALLVWGVLLAAVVTTAASLACYYRYAAPLASGSSGPLNGMATDTWPTQNLVNPLQQFASGRFAQKTHSPPLHFAIGFAVTAFLTVAALRWSWWPFLPLGYLISSTWYIQTAWFSIILGWLCKSLVVRFGGAKFYQQARPFFFGLVFGEALAAATWMVLNLALAWAGADYRTLNLLPT